ncbi:ubiquinone/menaquinone biosynthesis methyltransferase [Naegleria gruberi]|uniref:2-methoxy-6-polyprenyl-1,4-benzoquinol methylase, mitochondrial n=1 Tax=Naegleria gruberi TaxID=5762 RepID=D2VG74_NAEGR|nr:ubiquinone/menaquinone biosynthesis methyltransferase [Naegleria gruberi]EFC44221.1 ubiquinone/menaquinone biosynthesis methyltransferase [Naegleria gruberi]|eukprot:XP_002676965.1 ubiquinone/menaquinone biosynthesis methyltransferase [Naegleria gruberi strain NEG-M]
MRKLLNAQTIKSGSKLLRNNSSSSSACLYHESKQVLNNSSAAEQNSTTHFGFKTVLESEKEKLVGGVFHNVASRYDIMNDLMSGSLHRVWKDQLIEYHYKPQAGGTYLDVAGGTGDVGFRIVEALRRNSPPGVKSKVIISDINPSMLQVGKDNAARLKLSESSPNVEIDWLEANAEDFTSKIESNSVDGYTICFGIRNCTHIDRVLKEAYRVLKPGGCFCCLEFSEVNDVIVKQIYDWYSFNVIPKMGELVANDADSYQYLVESIRKFPNQTKFKGMIEEAGFKNARYTNLTFGVVAIHSGIKL